MKTLDCPMADAFFAQSIDVFSTCFTWSALFLEMQAWGSSQNRFSQEIDVINSGRLLCIVNSIVSCESRP